MTTLELLSRLRRLGAALGVEGGELRCRAPQGVLTPELLQELRARKAELLAYLSQAVVAPEAPVEPIPRVPRDAELPLSFGQQRLWFLDQLTPRNPAYNVCAAVALKGELDADALRRALAAVAARHEALRTVFRAQDGRPRQVILEPAEVPLPLHHLDARDPASREAALADVAREHARRPFDLERGPTFRADLVRVEATHHVLLLAMHHAVADGWSLGILVRELAAAYTDLRAGRPCSLPELPVQYADYAVWQRRRVSGARLERLADYWRRKLDGNPPALPLGRRTHLAAPDDSGSVHTFTLPPELTLGLHALTRAEGGTLFMTLMAALYVLLSRYTGECDVPIGFPIANRSHPQVEPLIGFFANTLVLRQQFPGDPAFRELLRGVRETALDAFTHQDLPFDHLIEVLQPERDLGRNPLFQVMFALQNVPMPALEFCGLRLEPVEVDNRTAKFDLNFSLTEAASGLRGAIQYRNDLFDARDIERLAGHYATLLAGAVKDPGARLHALPLLTDAERRAHAVVGEALRPERRGRVEDAFAEQARRTPERAAVVAQGASLTYAELLRRASALAARLRALGVGADDRVGLCLERSCDLPVAILGTLQAGGAYLPLDAALPRERLAFMLKDAAPRAVVAHARQAAALPAHGLPEVWLDADPLPDAPHDVAPAARALSPDGLAYLIYTSGSTGAPKAVAITHRSLLNLVDGLQRAVYSQLGPEPLRVGLNGPLSFDTSVKQWVQVLRGHTLHVLPDELRADAPALLARLAAEPLDVLDCTPSQLRLLLEAGLLDEPRCAPLALLLGGEAVDQGLWRRLGAARERRFFNLYGPTECTVDATACRVRTPPDDPTLGSPLANVRAYVLDRRGQPVPAGIPGELALGGAGVGRGYHGRPALTADAFRPDPFAEEDGARLYLTRDVVRRLADDELEFLGRGDRLVKVRGLRIELQEIEQALCRLPPVRQAAVVLRELGAGDARLLAYVVPAPGPAPSARELQAALRESLPGYMVPADFVTLAALPLNANGKTDYGRLPAVEHSPRAPRERARAPRDLVELELVRIFEELLHVRGVSVDDGFFELGGHSFLAVLLLAKVKQRLGRDLPLQALFQAGTIEQLAALVRKDGGAPGFSPLVAIRAEGARAPLFCIHPVGGNVLCYLELAEALGPDQPFYALQAAPVAAGQAGPSIEQLAARYLADLRRVQPHGPYRLGGWSLGGVIAFEMARQLEAAGEATELLALIDSRAPDVQRRVGPDGEAGLLALFARDLAGRAGLEAPPAEALAEGEGRGDPIEALLRVAGARGVLPPDVDREHLRALLELFVANLRAERAYVARPAGVRATLVLSEEAARLSPDEPTLGWGALALGGVFTRRLAGTHYSLMRRPQVIEVARALQPLLDDERGGDARLQAAAASGLAAPLV